MATLFADPRFVSAAPFRINVSSVGVSMPQGPFLSPMDVGETITGAIDFARWLPPGVTISSVDSVEIDNITSSDIPLSSLVGSPAIGTASWLVGGSGQLNTAIFQQWQAVAVGQTRVTMTVLTSDGQTLSGWARQSNLPGPVVGQTAPANISLPVISGTAQVGQLLMTSSGTWTQSPIAFGYQWLSDDVPISGAISQFYVPVTGDIGNLITVDVIAVNLAGVGSASSAAVGPVASPGPDFDFSQPGNSQYIPLLARPSSYTPFQAHYDRIARRMITTKDQAK